MFHNLPHIDTEKLIMVVLKKITLKEETSAWHDQEKDFYNIVERKGPGLESLHKQRERQD